MAEIREVIERVITEADSRGLGDATRALIDMARAEDELRASAEAVTVSTEKQDRTAESAQRRYDRLRAQIDATYRAQQAYKRDVDTLKLAQEQLHISTEEVARNLALLQERHFGVGRAAQMAASAQEQAAAAALRASAMQMRGLSVYDAQMQGRRLSTPDFSALGAASAIPLASGAQQAARSVGLARYELVQMQAQLSDLGIQVMSGGSPFTAIMQQGSQLAPILGAQGGGLRGAVTALGAGFMSMLTPVNLAVVGLATVASVIPTIWSAWSGGADRMKQDIEEHNRLLAEMRDRYGAVAAEARSFALGGESVTRFRLGQSIDRLKFDLVATGQGLQSQVSGVASGRYNSFPELLPVLTKMNEDLAKGTFNAERFQAALVGVASTHLDDKDLVAYIAGLLKGSDAALDLQRNIAAAQAMQNSRPGPHTLADAAAVRNRERLEEARAAAAERDRRNNEFAREILANRGAGSENLNAQLQRRAATDALSGATVRMSESDRLALASIRARTVAEQIAVAVGQRRLQLSSQTMSAAERQSALDQAAAEVIARSTRQAEDTLLRSQQQYDLSGLSGYARGLAEINQRYDEQIRLAAGNAEAIKALSDARALDLRAYQQQQIVNPLVDRGRNLDNDLALMRVRRDTFGAPTAEAQAAIERQRIINDLIAKGVSDLGPYKDLIDQTARAYGDMAAAAEDLADRQGKVIESLDSIRDLSRDIGGGLLKDLSRGKNPMDTLIQAGYRFGDRLIDQGINSMVESYLGKQGTAQGPLGDFFSKLFGAKDVKIPDLLKDQIVTSMSVQAATVTISGGLSLSGLGGLPGLGGKSSAEALSPLDAMQLRAQSGWNHQPPGMPPIPGLMPAGFGALSPGTRFGGITPDPSTLALLNRTALAYGINPRDFATMARIESGFDPLARNGSMRGMFQFSPGTARDFGLADPYNPLQAADAAARLWNANKSGLSSILGRDPVGWELYAAHQQGLGGMSALLRNPNMAAANALNTLPYYANHPGLANLAITGNGGTLGMTSTQFLDLWRSKFEKMLPPLGQMPPALDAMKAATQQAGGGLGQLGNLLNNLGSGAGGGGGLFGGIFSLIGSLFGGGTGSPDGSIGGLYADGGWIHGPGGPRDDAIPARLSNGEFVVNALSASRHRHVLEAINSGALDRAQRRADGGWIGASAARDAALASISSGGGGGSSSYSSVSHFTSGDVYITVPPGQSDREMMDNLRQEFLAALAENNRAWAEADAKRRRNAWRYGSADTER